MLAGAEAHFEPDIGDPSSGGEIFAEVAARFRDQRQRRQERFEQTRLARAQLRPLAAAVMLAPERQVRRRL
jgi:hypothetical protein